MYDELVQRLRKKAEAFDYDGWVETASDYEQAADVIEKFQDYMKAEGEGRMIILPVKEGTPLYVDGKIFASHCKGEIHEVKDWYYSFPMIYKDFRGEHDYVIDPDSIGNSVFLTREEAEENLAKEKR